jgi:aminoglycoside phosphotransferase family enzyme/predicted kinase
MAPPSSAQEAPHLEFVDTFASWVFLTPTDVWKVKKPVMLGFLDYTSAEKRRLACEAEVRLNRRLAPDVYRGVVRMTRGPDDRLRIGGKGEAADWAVHMNRLPDEDRADLRLASDRLDDEKIRCIATRLAAFHEAARCDAETSSRGRIESLKETVALAIHEPGDRDVGRDTPPIPEAEAAAAWQNRFLEANPKLFAARLDNGRIREGHGELSLEHVFIDDAGAVNIVDCLEYDDALRCSDVCSDVAFLSTDLASRGRVNLAERLVAEYAAAADDFDLYPLLDFYASLRASIRGKIEWFYATRPGVDRRAREARLTRARRFFLMAVSAERRPLLPPTIVVLGGQVASGKSTIARHVAAEIGAPLISADRTRSFMLGARADDAHEAQWELAYEPGFSHRVYAELMRRAGAVLRSGRPVVLDGCFRSATQRSVARRMAARYERPFLFVEVRVDPGRQEERLRARAKRDGVDEQVWLDIATGLADQWEAAEELPEEESLTIDGARSIQEDIGAVEARLPTWPANLRG